jgi:RNA polymerase sigma factor (sigma-70 family)
VSSVTTDDRHIDLVTQAIRGDEAAIKLLLVQIKPRLAAYVARKLPADVARTVGVEDIILETYVEIFRRISTFVPRGEDAFYRWAATIALSRIRNAAKKQHAVKRGGARPAGKPVTDILDASTLALWDLIAGTQTTPSRGVTRDEAIRATQLAVQHLPEHYRQAVWLVHIEGRPIKVAAATMQRSERSIHGLCQRGLRLLKEELGTFTRFL